jgi:diacylglycerol kinase (ATP)
MTENKNLPFFRRFSFALQGLLLSLKSESSFRTHVIIAFAVMIVAALIRPAPLWWALLAIAIAAVIAAELLNTAIERLADHVRPEFDEEIKTVKDVAAAAVLIASFSAIVVAIAFAAEHFFW